MSKQVVFQGISYDVPDWARYIAQDGHATITVHENPPTRFATQWHALQGRWDVLSGCGAPMVCVEVS